jgi:hypothetical protein
MIEDGGARLTTEQLARRWGKSPGTIANWRYKHPPRGPRYMKIGGSVFYPLAAVIEYERKNTKLVEDGKLLEL